MYLYLEECSLNLKLKISSISVNLGKLNQKLTKLDIHYISTATIFISSHEDFFRPV